MKDNLVVRLGLFLSTILFTIICILISFLIVISAFLIFKKEIIIRYLLYSIIIPIIIAPPLIIYYGRLVIKVSQLEEKMRLLATRDQLTNVLNRHGLYENVFIIQKLSIRNKKPFSLLYCDLDHFKKINDKFGHEAGDLVLQETCKMIQSVTRESDIFARLGGEEFLLVLNETRKNKAIIVAKKIKEAISLLVIKYMNNTIRITISIGISDNAKKLNTSFDHLISMADKALFESKNNGRNRISVYEQ